MTRRSNSLCCRLSFLPFPAVGAEAPAACVPAGGGRLLMEISGHFEASVNWDNESMRCAGGPRPDGNALRLMFSHEGDALLVVIAVTGLERGGVGAGLPANLTLVREGRAEFFGTLGADTCLVDVEENAPLDGVPGAYRVRGQGRCLAPIEAVAGTSEIRIAPFEFTGYAEWPAAAGAD